MTHLFVLLGVSLSTFLFGCKGTSVCLQVSVHCHAQGSLVRLALQNRDNREAVMEAELQTLKSEVAQHAAAVVTTENRAMVSS